MIEFSEYVKLTVSLFAISLPILAAAVFLGITREYSEKDKLTTMLATSLIYFTILTIFTFFGENILRFFSISIESFKVAGGIVLFLGALQLINSKKSHSDNSDEYVGASPWRIAVVPLGMPLLVGAGNISTIVIYTHLHPSLQHELLMMVGVFTNTIVVFLTFWLTNKFGKLLNETVINIMNRLLGLIVASMAMEFIFTGSVGQIQMHWH